jgi:hypothetical protein
MLSRWLEVDTLTASLLALAHAFNLALVVALRIILSVVLTYSLSCIAISAETTSVDTRAFLVATSNSIAGDVDLGFISTAQVRRVNYQAFENILQLHDCNRCR